MEVKNLIQILTIDPEFLTLGLWLFAFCGVIVLFGVFIELGRYTDDRNIDELLNVLMNRGAKLTWDRELLLHMSYERLGYKRTLKTLSRALSQNADE